MAAFTRGDFPVSDARAALDRLHARGPDSEGEWRENRVYLGHRRLAILDLDPRAAQPMHSACGRYVIVFNGEIYNYRDLRRGLEARGVVFRTASDTEVLLALFAEQGEAMLPLLHGMFAFVIWDRQRGRAFAARDPYGIKPLYMATIDDGVLLASQVKALLATGLVARDPDAVGQAGFWMLGSVPEPRTWYRAIEAVPAGHCLWTGVGNVTERRCWQDIGAVWRATDASAVETLKPEEISVRVREALRESVARHLVADVPVGVFLSGGIDSGALAGLMVEAGARDLQGVTIAYDEFAGRHEDEAPVAALLARHYGIQHHVRRVCREEFLADLPRILAAMDQPTIDGINTWYASKAVAELGLKVVVSGVGGDEMFLGYESFRRLPRMVSGWRRFARVPGVLPLSRVVAGLQARRSGNARWCHAPAWARTIGGAWWLRRSVQAPETLAKWLGEPLAAEALRDFSAEGWVARMAGPLAADAALALAQIESATYLRNQLLRDSDWASMDHSVELRTPLVDAHLLHQMQPLLPYFRCFPNKTLLAKAPQNPLPDTIISRPKTGFGIPIQRWLREAGLSDGLGWQGWMQAVGRAYEGC
ncbi:MAG: asparagine synthase (glutamine-hydrolyzing) [Methylococcus sp.]|nr:asparagine synthase (glutamine-hydrolyzing) [Methylococcus sp.]